MLESSTWYRFRRVASQVPTWVWALPCAALAALYAVVWPSSAASSGSFSPTYVILRWGHSATWVLLALSFIVRSSTIVGSRKIANVLAVIALIIYVVFLLSAARGIPG